MSLRKASTLLIGHKKTTQEKSCRGYPPGEYQELQNSMRQKKRRLWSQKRDLSPTPAQRGEASETRETAGNS